MNCPISIEPVEFIPEDEGEDFEIDDFLED